MMKKIIFTLVMMFMLSGTKAFPQHVSRNVYVIDDVDGKAVAYAQVTNEKGVTAGRIAGKHKRGEGDRPASVLFAKRGGTLEIGQ